MSPAAVVIIISRPKRPDQNQQNERIDLPYIEGETTSELLERAASLPPE